MKMNALLLLSLLSGIVTSCQGQNNTRTTGKLPGISRSVTGDIVPEPDKSILYILQDKKNRYWFGSSASGIYRYDGTTTIHFSTKDGLCDNRVRGIQEDRAGNIYVNTAKGISKFDGQIFTTLHSTGSKQPDGGWRLQPDDLWFTGAQDSGVVYRYDGTTLYHLKFPETEAGEAFISKYPRAAFPQMTFSPYDVYSIYTDRKGNLWFGTNIGVCRYDGRTFTWISEEELGIDDISFHVRSTYEDKKGRFWFTNTMQRFIIYANDSVSKGKDIFKKEKGIVGSKDHAVAYFMSSTEDDEGNLWMVTYNKGVWRYDGNKLTQYTVTDGDQNANLFSVYKDKGNKLWLGTHSAGVYRFNGRTFEPFRP
jgi:sugar lactone lactonase YvrE